MDKQLIHEKQFSVAVELMKTSILLVTKALTFVSNEPNLTRLLTIS